MLIFKEGNNSLKLYVTVFISLVANQIGFLEGNTITTEKSEGSGASCENELSLVFCESIVDNDSCPGYFEESPLRSGCRKSCGLCHDQNESGEESIQNREDVDENPLNTGGGCEDKIPNCSSYLSMCCSMKDAMNTSCAKTCKFCSETPVPPGAPGAPGGIPAPTASTGQDPCSPTDPPSVTVDAPGAPGQTTTTQSPIGTIPGVSIDGSIPGQTTTTTTQASITGPGNLPGNPVG